MARILMTADAVGGVWQYTLQLAALLAARGVRVMVATMGPEPSSAQRREAASIPGLMLRSTSLKLEWMVGAWREVDTAGEWLLQLEAEYAPDVIHLNGYAHASLPWHAPVLVVAHSCVCSWWDAVHHTPAPGEWDEYRRRVSAGLRAAHRVVAPTCAMRDALVRFYGAGHETIVIPNCSPGVATIGGAKEPLIFAAGRIWDPAKNIAVLDQAAGSVTWPAYVAGDAAGPGGATQTLTAITCVGRQSPHLVRNWMSRASIYALPARYEPFGLSVLEAALCGCALVLGDIQSLRENWQGVARFVHPDGADDLRQVLQELIDRPEERAAMGEAARRRAAAFSPAAHVHAYDNLYRELVATYGRIAHSTRSH